MHFLLQQFGNTFEMELAGAFYQDQFVFELFEGRRLDELLRCQIKLLFDIEDTPVFFQVAADTDDAVDLLSAHQVRDFLVQRLRQRSRLQDIRKDQRAFQVLFYAAALLEVEGDIQRVDIRIVGIVYQQAVVDTLLYIQTHGDRFEALELFDVVHTRRLQIQHHSHAMDDVFNRSIVGERDRVCPVET